MSSLVDVVATSISGLDIEWCKRALNAHFGDRVMIETDGQEIGEWLDPPRPEPGVPAEPDEEYEE